VRRSAHSGYIAGMTTDGAGDSYSSDVDPVAQLARVPQRPTRADAGVVGVLFAWSAAEQVALNGADGLVPALLFFAAVSLPLLWRRQHPLEVLAAVALVVVVRAFTAPEGVYGAAPFPHLLLLTFTLGVHVRPWQRSALLAGVPALLACLLSWTGYFGEFTAASILLLSFFVGGSWALGRTVQRAADQVQVEQARAAETARNAVEEERARIARELHDVVAHAVSIVVVQAGAAEALVDKDPVAARAHLAAVRRTGREALSEMRHLLHVLREGEPTYVPQPGLAALAELVGDVTRTGTPITLELDPELGELPAGVELCAYRVVQEALTNVCKHAPGARTTVTLSKDDEELNVTVRNELTFAVPPDLGPGGHGLAGMAERVRLYGGRLATGRTAEGFRVQAHIPLGTS
jgi:signal transduction histidine kinase